MSAVLSHPIVARKPDIIGEREDDPSIISQALVLYCGQVFEYLSLQYTGLCDELLYDQQVRAVWDESNRRFFNVLLVFPFWIENNPKLVESVELVPTVDVISFNVAEAYRLLHENVRADDARGDTATERAIMENVVRVLREALTSLYDLWTNARSVLKLGSDEWYAKARDWLLNSKRHVTHNDQYDGIPNQDTLFESFDEARRALAAAIRQDADEIPIEIRKIVTLNVGGYLDWTKIQCLYSRMLTQRLMQLVTLRPSSCSAEMLEDVFGLYNQCVTLTPPGQMYDAVRGRQLLQYRLFKSPYGQLANYWEICANKLDLP